MAELSVVRRYARALFDSANKGGIVEAVEADLSLIHQVVRATPALLQAFKSPHLSMDQRKGLLSRTFGAQANPLTQRFLTLLVDRRREDVLKDVYLEFRMLANAARSIVPVEVRSAVPLSDAERDALGKSLANRTGKKVQLELHVDPELMGGIVVRMGDTVIDGSVAGKLRQLKAKLVASQS